MALNRMKPYPHDNAGYALVLTLWLVMLLSFFVFSSSETARFETRLNRHFRNELLADTLNETAIWLALEQHLQQRPISSVRSTEVFTLDGHSINVEVKDLASMINLNYAPKMLLHKLFSATTELTPEATDTLMQNIHDWIDSDDDTPRSSSEKAFYKRSGFDYVPPNRLFTSLSELRLVAGMTETIYQQVSPHLTVVGTLSQINQSHFLAGGDNSAVFTTNTPSNLYLVSSKITLDNLPFATRAIVDVNARQSIVEIRVLAWHDGSQAEGESNAF